MKGRRIAIALAAGGALAGAPSCADYLDENYGDDSGLAPDAATADAGTQDAAIEDACLVDAAPDASLAFVGAVTASIKDSWSPTPPDGALPGDVLVAVLSFGNAGSVSGASLVAPEGWTSVGQLILNSASLFFVLARNPPCGKTFTFTGDEGMGWLLAYRGADLAHYHFLPGVGDAGYFVNAGPIDASAGDAVIAAFACWVNNQVNLPTWTFSWKAGAGADGGRWPENDYTAGAIRRSGIVGQFVPVTGSVQATAVATAQRVPDVVTWGLLDLRPATP